MWLVVATVAAGGGDVAFAVQLIEALASRGPRRLVLCVCAQATAEPHAAAERILNGLSPAGRACVAAVRASKRTRDSAEPVCDWRVLNSMLDTRGLSLQGVLQGPLRCFDNGHAAAAALCSPLLSTDGPIPLLTVREFGQSAFCPPCPALSSGCWSSRDAWAAAPSKHIDVSAGLLADRELGVFRISMPPASDGARVCVSPACAAVAGGAGAAGRPDAAAAEGTSGGFAARHDGTPRLPYIVGYFRTERHCRQLGRLSAAFLRLSSMSAAVAARAADSAVVGAASGAGTAGSDSFGIGAAGSAADGATARVASFSTAAQAVVVLMPFVTDAAFAAFCSGLADVGITTMPFHAAAAAAADATGGGGAASAAGDVALPLAAQVSFGSERLASFSVAAPVIRSWACSLPAATAASPRSITIHVIDTHAVRLPTQYFRCLLAGASAAIVTGDASLNEALCCASAPWQTDDGSTDAERLLGLPFWYSAEPHKRDVDVGLRAAFASAPTSKSIIALRQLLDAKVTPRSELAAGEASADDPMWSRLCEALYQKPGLPSGGCIIADTAGAPGTLWTALQQQFAAAATALLSRSGCLGERILCLVDSAE